MDIGQADDYEPRNNLSQYLLFGPRAHHVLDPRNVETILSTNFMDYGFGVLAEVFAPLLGEGIFTQEGLAWKHSRELLRLQFQRTQYQSLDNLREHVDNLLDCLPSQGCIDLQPLFFKLTLDTTTALLFGQSVGSLKTRTNDSFREFANNFDIAQGGLAKRFRLAPWHAFYRPLHLRRACSAVHNFMDNYIQEVRIKRQGDPVGPRLDTFVHQLEQESSTPTGVRDHLLNILLAGRDTTACCLAWTMRLLVRHPRVMSQLGQQIQSVIGTSQHPTKEQIRSMPYLSFVIKESLRLFPPVPLNNRTALRATTLPRGGGPDGNAPILVRKGEMVVFSQYVDARRKNIYGPDADEFIPERWECEPSRFGWAYFPFNGGPRACLGRDFALMEISYTIVRLLQAFPSISLPANESNETPGTERQRLTLVLQSADGCKVDLTRATEP